MYGLIGYPLSHSFSKDFFTKKFAAENIQNTVYQNFPISGINQFRTLIDSNPNLKGLNVTIPYKEKIIPFLDSVDPTAAAIGAVNTIKFENTGKGRYLKGYNTDVWGFRRSLEEIKPPRMEISRAVILGTGGASKAIAWVLKEMNIAFEFVSTSSGTALKYGQLNKKIISDCQLIVNTSPLGTFPDVSQCPDIPYEYLTGSHLLFDLVYNPALTLFLRKGQERGANTSNGLKMLEYQALKSWEIWNS